MSVPNVKGSVRMNIRRVLRLRWLVYAALGLVAASQVAGAQSAPHRPVLELLLEVPLGNVAEDQVPDLSEAGWALKVTFSKPIVVPDGSKVLVATADDMQMYDTSDGKLLWKQPIYGGIDKYDATNEIVYLSEAGSSGRFKERSYIYAIDAASGAELWRYDLQQDARPWRLENMPEGAEAGSAGFTNINVHEGVIYAKVSDSWKDGSVTDRTEVLVALDDRGGKLWEIRSRGYPGLFSTGRMEFLADKLIIGSYTYGDDTHGPAYVQAFDLADGQLLWRQDLPWEPLNYARSNNASVTIVGDKVVASTSFGRVYVFTADGEALGDFLAWEPVDTGENVITTYVLGGKVAGFGDDNVVIAPSKTVIQGAAASAVSPVEHPDANSVLVYNLQGERLWKFALGAPPLNLIIKGDIMLLGTSSESATAGGTEDTGVYAFSLAGGAGGEFTAADSANLEQFLGFFRTDGIIYVSALDSSADQSVIAAVSWPTRSGVTKSGEHALYILTLK